MTRLEKCKLFEAKGFTYDPITGEITTHKGRVPKPRNDGYIQLKITLNGKQIHLYGHHFAWWMIYRKAPDEDLDIDHDDRVKTNNRITNLKLKTHKENSLNRDWVENAKGYTFYKPTGKWLAYIRVDGKPKYLGYFSTEQEARQAYLTALEFYYPDRYNELNNKT